MAKYKVPILATFEIGAVEVDAKNPIEALKAASELPKYGRDALLAEITKVWPAEGTGDPKIHRGRAEKVKTA